MKFSILVPVYNVEKYLEQCVESLLNQTYKGDYEIILVDDGSTDSSGVICDRYAENNPDRIRVVHKENGGHTSARLEAIKNATGEYSLFCDSDDFVECNLLETVDGVLNNNPNTDMVMYSFCYYENGKKRDRNLSVFDGTEIFEGPAKKKLYEFLIMTPYLNSLWTKAIKTTILQQDPTDYSKILDKDIAEDAFASIYLISESNRIINIDSPLYNYRIIAGSISRSCDIAKLSRKNTLYVYDRFMEYLPKWGMNDDEHIQKLHASWLNGTMYAFKQYYENSKDKKAVLNYDWSSMLPKDYNVQSSNPYENKVYKKLYLDLSEKKFCKVRFYFIKDKTRRFIKKLLK